MAYSINQDGYLVSKPFLEKSINDNIEFSPHASFPTTGKQNKLYIATDTHEAYIWDGTAFVKIA